MDTQSSYLQKYQDDIIFDEEYEVHSKTWLNSLCPFCNQFAVSTSKGVFNISLKKECGAHEDCCSKFQNKMLGYKLFSWQSQTYSHLDVTLWNTNSEICDLQKDFKCFIELQLFHLFSTTPLIHINSQGQLQQTDNDGLIIVDLNEKEQKIYQPKQIFVPILEGRIQLDIYIYDQHKSLTFPFNNLKRCYTYDITKQLEGNICIQKKENLQQISFVGQIQKKKPIELQQTTAYQFDKDLFQNQSQNHRFFNIHKIVITVPNLFPNARKQSDDTVKPNYYTPQMYPKQSVTSTPKEKFLQASPPFSLDNLDEDYIDFESIKGQIANFIKTQHGSRLFQKFLNNCTSQEMDLIINEIQYQIADLMIDPYANFIFGSLSQNCSPQQRLIILKMISARIVQIACDKKGTHAVQALISLISCRQEEELIQQILQNYIVHLSLDSQGTHLVRKIITRLSEEKLLFIFDQVLPRFIELVNHQFGLCVIKDIMTKYKNNEFRCQQLIQKITDHLDQIVQDPYGNYAIQHALEIYGDKQCSQIIDRIIQMIVQLSIHKYSSNVVEKCILETSEQTCAKFIRSLCNEEISLELMKNKFGSFVLQKALNKSQNKQLRVILYQNLNQLYANNIRQKWLEYLESGSRNNSYTGTYK